MDERLCVGLNGCGRFGLRLLKYWLDRSAEAPFTLAFLNDDTLTLEQVAHALRSEALPGFGSHEIRAGDSTLRVVSPGGVEHRVAFSRVPADEIPWAGAPHLVLECSGKRTDAAACAAFLTGRTRQVLVSATSPDADQTLVYGHNHESWRPDARVLSFGSCTVNAYVPLAAWIHRRWGVRDSDVNVVHSRLRDVPAGETLVRRTCTLETAGPRLLPFLQGGRLAVNYTLVPYTGVSSIDFRFRLERPAGGQTVLRDLSRSIREGPLRGLYGMEDEDTGPDVHAGTSLNAILIASQARVAGDNLYLHAYFDTENSVSRYFDVAGYVCRRFLSEDRTGVPLQARGFG